MNCWDCTRYGTVQDLDATLFGSVRYDSHGSISICICDTTALHNAHMLAYARYVAPGPMWAIIIPRPSLESGMMVVVAVYKSIHHKPKSHSPHTPPHHVSRHTHTQETPSSTIQPNSYISGLEAGKKQNHEA